VGIFDKFFSLFAKAGPQPEPLVAPVASKPVERRCRDRMNACPGTRVLIIDDSRTIVAALRKMLHSAGYRTMEALDAESGLEIVRSQPVDLIFLDIVLPGINGFSALRQLRKDPQTRAIPVIMMSGNEQATEQFFGSRIGADDFMKKPFSRQEVFARIERLLDTDFKPRRLQDSTKPAVARA
jgi:DNA-binding response OmpR family regulator